MTQQDTQPPAETLVEARATGHDEVPTLDEAIRWLAKFEQQDEVASTTPRKIAFELAGIHSLLLGIRAGGDAIPAGEAWERDNPFPAAPQGCEGWAKYLLPQADWYAAKAAFLRSLATPKPPAGGDAGATVTCAAVKQGTAGGNEPGDCDWPVCGCDPHAARVIAALEEAGHLKPPAGGDAGAVEGGVEKEARFLCDRLAEFEREITDDDLFTQFNGHIAPSAARLRAALSEDHDDG